MVVAVLVGQEEGLETCAVVEDGARIAVALDVDISTDHQYLIARHEVCGIMIIGQTQHLQTANNRVCTKTVDTVPFVVLIEG